VAFNTQKITDILKRDIICYVYFWLHVAHFFMQKKLGFELIVAVAYQPLVLTMSLISRVLNDDSSQHTDALIT